MVFLVALTETNEKTVRTNNYLLSFVCTRDDRLSSEKVGRDTFRHRSLFRGTLVTRGISGGFGLFGDGIVNTEHPLSTNSPGNSIPIYLRFLLLLLRPDLDAFHFCCTPDRCDYCRDRSMIQLDGERHPKIFLLQHAGLSGHIDRRRRKHSSSKEE